MHIFVGQTNTTDRITFSAQLVNSLLMANRAGKCGDTIGWFPELAISDAEIFLQIEYTKQFYQTALGNCYGLKLPKC